MCLFLKERKYLSFFVINKKKLLIFKYLIKYIFYVFQLKRIYFTAYLEYLCVTMNSRHQMILTSLLIYQKPKIKKNSGVFSDCGTRAVRFVIFLKKSLSFAVI